MAEAFEVLDDEPRARAFREQAETLRRKFNEVFWMEGEGCFAYGLDPDKKQITSIASNAGQVLWSGIADRDKAERTARRLLQEDMWSGWFMPAVVDMHFPCYNTMHSTERAGRSLPQWIRSRNSTHTVEIGCGRSSSD